VFSTPHTPAAGFLEGPTAVTCEKVRPMPYVSVVPPDLASNEVKAGGIRRVLQPNVVPFAITG